MKPLPQDRLHIDRINAIADPRPFYTGNDTVTFRQSPLVIMSMSVIDGAPNLRGDRLLAVVDLSFAGIVIKGCTLNRYRDGTINVNGPNGRNSMGWRLSTRFRDTELSEAITLRVAEAYAAMSGPIPVNDDAAA